MARAFSAIIYGREGAGKTSVGLQFPGPVFCQSIYESGYDTLEDIPANSTNEDVKTFEQLLNNTKGLLSASKGTLLIDSCTGLQRIIFDYCCRNYYGNDFSKFMAYHGGPRNESVATIQIYLDLCSQLVNKGIYVIFLGHEVTEKVPNAMGADPICHDIQLDGSSKGGLRNTMKAWVDNIFFLNQSVQISVATDQTKGVITAGKAISQPQRYIYTDLDVVHSAKNKWNMPTFISMGNNPKEAFNNLWKHIPERFRLPRPSPTTTPTT